MSLAWFHSFFIPCSSRKYSQRCVQKALSGLSIVTTFPEGYIIREGPEGFIFMLRLAGRS